VSGCLLLPFAALLYLLKRLSRKILYVLTIRDAARSLSAYWHRAHLIDHMVRAGHVSPGQPVSLALASFQNSLDETSIVGLRQCGRQLIRGAHHIFSTLMRALRQGADSSLRPQAAFLKDQWETMAVTLAKAVDSYEHHYLAGDCAALPTTTGAPPQDG
jgi:hypothetical protein